jgi:hypothetical protein
MHCIFGFLNDVPITKFSDESSLNLNCISILGRIIDSKLGETVDSISTVWMKKLGDKLRRNVIVYDLLV